MAKPLCDGFTQIVGGTDEFLVEVFGTDDGWVEEYSVSLLLEDGTTQPYDPKTPEENDRLQEAAQRIYNEWCQAAAEFD